MHLSDDDDDDDDDDGDGDANADDDDDDDDDGDDDDDDDDGDDDDDDVDVDVDVDDVFWQSSRVVSLLIHPRAAQTWSLELATVLVCSTLPLLLLLARDWMQDQGS